MSANFKIFTFGHLRDYSQPRLGLHSATFGTIFGHVRDYIRPRSGLHSATFGTTFGHIRDYIWPRSGLHSWQWNWGIKVIMIRCCFIVWSGLSYRTSRTNKQWGYHLTKTVHNEGARTIYKILHISDSLLYWEISHTNLTYEQV